MKYLIVGGPHDGKYYESRRQFPPEHISLPVEDSQPVDENLPSQMAFSRAHYRIDGICEEDGKPDKPCYVFEFVGRRR